MEEIAAPALREPGRAYYPHRDPQRAADPQTLVRSRVQVGLNRRQWGRSH